MATEITCGADCGFCKPGRGYWYHVAPCDEPRPVIGGQRPTMFATLLQVKHCPNTGSPLGFAPEGVPTVGAPYAEVQRKADALAADAAKWQPVHEWWDVQTDKLQASGLLVGTSLAQVIDAGIAALAHALPAEPEEE